MNGTTKTFLIMSAITLVAASAFAQPVADQCGPCGGALFGPRMVKALDLSEAQNGTIKSLLDAQRESMVKQRKEIMRLRNELRGLMLQDDPAEAKAESLTRRIGDLRTELRVARTKTRFAIREQLTEEQRDRMMMLKENGREGCRSGRRAMDRCRDGDGPRGPRDHHDRRGGCR